MIRSSRASKAVIESRIRKAIDGLVPLLRIEQSVIELIEFEVETGTAHLRIGGGCAECEMSATMLLQGIETNLKIRVPEIVAVHAVSDDDASRDHH
jgi:Fe-S cluster biogenesis protein NfuA